MLNMRIYVVYPQKTDLPSHTACNGKQEDRGPTPSDFGKGFTDVDLRLFVTSRTYTSKGSGPILIIANMDIGYFVARESGGSQTFAPERTDCKIFPYRTLRRPRLF